MGDRPTSVKDLDFKPHGDVFPSPRDWRDQFLYQLLIDRFDDTGDHPAYHPKESPRNRDEKNAMCCQGGKLKGITRRLDYIKGLGCTAVWISPPFKNRQEDPVCHGYGIQDFLQVDPRFGTIEDLQELTREAHRRGMYIILDIVINHTGNNWGYVDDQSLGFNEAGKHEFGFWRKRDGGRVSADQAKAAGLGADDGVWPIELQDPEIYQRRGFIRDMSSAGHDEKIQGDFFDLKDVQLNNPAALDAMIRIYKYWIAIADIDGFRMDTVTHTEPGPTSNFCNAIKEFAKSIGKDNFFIFAEIVEGDEQLKKYIGQNTPAHGEAEKFPMFDAVLDFPLHFVLEEVIKEFQPPHVLRERYENFGNFYRDFGAAAQYFVTFVDNHDQITRKYRRFMAGCDDPRQVVLAIGYLLTNMGTPCLYYGTEQGFDGNGPTDAYIRETMFGGKWGAFDTTGVQFFNPKHLIYQGIAKIAAVRASEPALRYGREYFREISGDGENFGHPIDSHCTLAFARVLDVTSIVVAMNLTAFERSDCILVDGNLNQAGAKMINLLEPAQSIAIEQNSSGQCFVRVPLAGRTMAILKKADA